MKEATVRHSDNSYILSLWGEPTGSPLSFYRNSFGNYLKNN